ncbi:hypothetical protein CDAR_76821 [Caerostris darwini]|uniref:Uncharacterized protein n=1 Tax=Caerostris darwini TaxID=1538125 RepID=A0AAV4QBQ8_9ARAC|nr:hypothetical protein CDAR_76821 [Caerostris darwini]
MLYLLQPSNGGSFCKLPLTKPPILTQLSYKPKTGDLLTHQGNLSFAHYQTHKQKTKKKAQKPNPICRFPKSLQTPNHDEPLQETGTPPNISGGVPPPYAGR